MVCSTRVCAKPHLLPCISPRPCQGPAATVGDGPVSGSVPTIQFLTKCSPAPRCCKEEQSAWVPHVPVAALPPMRRASPAHPDEQGEDVGAAPHREQTPGLGTPQHPAGGEDLFLGGRGRCFSPLPCTALPNMAGSWGALRGCAHPGAGLQEDVLPRYTAPRHDPVFLGHCCWGPGRW